MLDRGLSSESFLGTCADKFTTCIGCSILRKESSSEACAKVAESEEKNEDYQPDDARCQ